MKKMRQLLCVIGIITAVCCMVMIGQSCSSRHYFSINAEEITNPSIMYSDSTGLTNPF